jgi:hypothetical protein
MTEAVGVYCQAKIVDSLPSKRWEQPPTIVFTLLQDYGSLLLHKLADPTLVARSALGMEGEANL